MTEADVYKTIGLEGFTRLVAAFYRRVRTDDILGPLYPPDDFDAAETRLRLFLIQRFGGPGDYSATRGHPRLRMRHAPFVVDNRAAVRWLALMKAAMEESIIDPNAAEALWPYFEQTAVHMINAPG
jgi:hemoglobin